MASTLNIQKIRQMESAIDNITDKIEVQKKEVIKAYKRLGTFVRAFGQISAEAFVSVFLTDI